MGKKPKKLQQEMQFKEGTEANVEARQAGGESTHDADGEEGTEPQDREIGKVGLPCHMCSSCVGRVRGLGEQG